MGKKSHRQRRGRGQKGASSFSTVVSSISTTAGNVQSFKSFTIQQLLPDIAAGRQVVVHSVSATWMNASAPATSPGASAQIQLQGEPWATGTSAGGAFASMPWKGLNATTRTVLKVVPNLPGQRFPVQLDRAGTAFQLNATSFLAGSWSVEITTRYRLTADTAITVIP